MSPFYPLCRRILPFLFLAFSIATPVFSQPADSLSACIEQGRQLLKEQRYSEAYSSFLYYIKNVPAERKITEEYGQVQKLYHEAWGKVKIQLERCMDEAEAARKKGQAKQADELFLKYISLCVTPESKETYPYTLAITQHALFLQRQGKIQEAIAELKRVAEIRRRAAYMDDGLVAETLNLIAAAEHQLGHFDEAIAQCTEALKIYKERYGRNHEHYGTTLSNLASYYTSRNAPGDRRYAVALGEEAVDVLPKSKPAYAQAMNNLVVYYSLSGDLVKAQKYAKLALKTTKKLEKTTVNYASILSNQAVRLANANNYEQALEYVREAIQIFEANGEDQSLNYARMLSNAASFEKHSEHYKEAIELWQRAAPIFERIEGKTSSGYLDCMSEISAAHAKTGNLEQAADINEHLQATASEQARTGDARYAHSLSKRASILATDGNYAQAITLEQQALSIFRLRKDALEEATCLNDLSGYLFHTGLLAEAIDSCQLALRLYENIKGHDEDRALALNNLSIYFYSGNRFDEALEASRKAVAYYEKAGRTSTSFFAKVLTNLALYEARRDSLQAAVALSLRADSIQRQVLGDIHPDNVMLMFNVANYYVRLGERMKAQRMFHDALEMQMQHVRANFSHLTTRGRELYWGTKSYIFRAAPYMACLMEDADSVLVDAYDAQLFTKGLLLNSEIDFRNLLQRTASPELQEKYAELVAVHQEIEAAWRTATEENKAQIPALTAQANRLERELVRGCKEYGDFTEAMNIHYSQVAEALAEHDAAIEFFDIDTKGDGRTYWALLTRHGWPAPRLVRLFSESELDQLRFNDMPLTQALTRREGIHAVFEDERAGRLVWGRLLADLQGVQNIWFAPSGLFYQWGIEYLRFDHRRINDLYALHRVSSTKLLVQKDTSAGRIRKAAVFGGLDYYASPTEIQLANQQLSQMDYDYLAAWDNAAREDMALADSRTLDGFLRGGRKEVGFLEGTNVEASLIGETLMQRDIDTEMYKGTDGTEEAFKRLGGRGISLLHIATHGFSLAEGDVKKNTNAMGYLDVCADASVQADNSLCYSGLLMAGANNVLSGRRMPQGLENGVLTAREIAQMDFRGLDLAVLSACQTGLGELKEDGVFGLQRGFKKAGARTLLMSLWSVDDEATQMMMTAFYNALATGLTRRQAFHTAQETLRSHPAFASPFYWASFVMLDD